MPQAKAQYTAEQARRLAAHLEAAMAPGNSNSAKSVRLVQDDQSYIEGSALLDLDEIR